MGVCATAIIIAVYVGAYIILNAVVLLPTSKKVQYLGGRQRVDSPIHVWLPDNKL